MKREDNWMRKYLLAKKYYEENGNLLIPIGYKIDGVKLGVWIHAQRQAYKGLCTSVMTDVHIKLLENIGMIWEFKRNTWDFMYSIAKDYYLKYGNLTPPSNYTVNGFNLSEWLIMERNKFKKNNLSLEKVELLNEIGMVWDINMSLWNEKYELAKAYYNHYGNLNIPVYFKTFDGINYDENGIKLGSWTAFQRHMYQYNKNQHQIELLEKIGMVWSIRQANWDYMYSIASEYYEEHGDLNIRYGSDKEYGIVLSKWLTKQRLKYKNNKLTKEQIKMLNKLGMIWEFYNEKWDLMYEETLDYYNEHGNIDIDSEYITENGNKLGSWINTQRKCYKAVNHHHISEERIAKLDALNIMWFSRYTDLKLQKEIIDDDNLDRKNEEIRNRIYSCLNTFDGNELPTKEEINKRLIKELR